MAAAANKDTCGVKVASEELAAIETGTVIAQCSAFVIFLIFRLSFLVFVGEERGQDKGEGGRIGGRRDDSSSCRRRPKTRRMQKKIR